MKNARYLHDFFPDFFFGGGGMRLPCPRFLRICVLPSPFPHFPLFCGGEIAAVSGMIFLLALILTVDRPSAVATRTDPH